MLINKKETVNLCISILEFKITLKDGTNLKTRGFMYFYIRI